MLMGYPRNYQISSRPQALPLQADAGARQSWEVQMSICLRRREFLVALGGVAALPLAAHAQQSVRMRRIGVLMSGDQNDPVAEAIASAFMQARLRAWVRPRGATPTPNNNGRS
jgi:hypothetical protein